jgi:eukaryotic-like serine/threonine-protein kinase
MDRYELGELVGRGGMGEVYLGHDNVLGRRVAIKLLADGRSRDAALAQRLLDEARVNALLEHPNVVRVHDLSITETTVFVVMEYLEGETLRARMRRDPAFPADHAVRIAADVCLALAAAHDADVVHRDIGPGNIMLCADDTVRVMDFGISGVAGSTFADGQTLGTPAYVSPEQAAGTAVDARSDLYSLGCTLYHMVTGRPPFTGSRPVEVAWQHCYADPRPPSTHRSDLPPAVETVILKAMAKSPEERYDSALQMREALLSAVDDSTAQDATPAADCASHPTVPHDPVPATPGAVRTYPPGAHVDWAAVEAADLVGVGADRRRERVGMALIVLALALLGVVLVVALGTP